MRNKPNLCAANDGSGDNHVFHLYVREKDRKAELWDGARSGTQAAADVFNADEVTHSPPGLMSGITYFLQTGNINEIRDILPSILAEASEIYTDIKSLNQPQSVLARYLYGSSGESEISKLVKSSQVKPLRPILNELRVFKSESEVVNMRKAGQASGRAFTESMKHNFATERELSAFLQYQFKAKGCDTSAFVPVVAGGSVSDHPTLFLTTCSH